MLHRPTLSVLLQGLILISFSPTGEASSLGMTVHVVPLNSNKGNTVRAHFSAIVPGSCTSVSGLCADAEDCLIHKPLIPFRGSQPGSGWCVHQWQKTVSADYSGTIQLGSNTDVYVKLNAAPVIRGHSGRLNQPAYAALPPPLRARVNCPHHFPLSVKDVDRDRVRCRFARAELGECVDCDPHTFIELDKDTCMLTFTGNAAAGQYFIFLMVEDLVPVPRISHLTITKPLSAVPVHLSLTVEERSTTSCTDEPVAAGETPEEHKTLYVVPFQEVKFTIYYESRMQSVSEIAVIGPPNLFRVGFTSVGPLATIKIGWVRTENKLARLLPVCFLANTRNLQSEPRCVWLYQRAMVSLPTGTELTCGKTQMTLVLPIGSLAHINVAELQLNSPTCPVTHNETHLTATIPLNGCGTKAVHSESELIYTNTLHTVRTYTRVIRRMPTLILPLACRIRAVNVTGPNYTMGMPTERQTFGDFDFRIEFYFPGEGPLKNFTRAPTFRNINIHPNRVRREAASSGRTASNSSSTRGAIGSRISQLDLHLMSTCSVARAEILVSSCIESETADFAVFQYILEQGCASNADTLEIVTTSPTFRVYRLNLADLDTHGSPMMYVRCTVYLCIATMPSQRCPELCSRAVGQRTALVDSVFSRGYTITSGPVSLVVTTPAPTTKTTTTTTAVTTDNTTTNTTSSHAPEKASSVAVGVTVVSICIFLQNIFFP